METGIFNALKTALQEGTYIPGHPFKYGTLGTVDGKNAPSLRTVVLRNVSENVTLTFYTDYRSKKIRHIAKNEKVCLLFYDPEKLLQLKIDGIATIQNDSASKENIWKSMPPHAKRDYTTVAAPGTPKLEEDDLRFLTDKDYFCSVEISPYQIEYLKLQRPAHLKMRFFKVNDLWESEFLVP